MNLSQTKPIVPKNEPASNKVAMRINSEEYLPKFGVDGVLPPHVGDLTTANQRAVAPYRISMKTLQRAFVWNDERAKLIHNLKRYINAVLDAEICIRFFWVGGSFVEQKPVNDIDVVIFCDVPEKLQTEGAIRDFAENRQALFNKNETLKTFSIDPSFVVLSNPPERLVQLTTYWTTIFSSRCGAKSKKGFVSVVMN